MIYNIILMIYSRFGPNIVFKVLAIKKYLTLHEIVFIAELPAVLVCFLRQRVVSKIVFCCPVVMLLSSNTHRCLCSKMSEISQGEFRVTKLAERLVYCNYCFT